MDIPRYRVSPNPSRLLFDRILLLICLSLLLYAGIFINYYLLGLPVPASVHWIVGVGIFLLAVLELILCYVKYASYAYEFHDNRIVVHTAKEQDILYSDFNHLEYHSDIFDRWFKTGTILLKNPNKTIKLKSLKNANQAYILIQKHIK